MKRLLYTAVIWGAVLLPMAAQAQRGMGSHGSSAPTARAGSGFASRPAGFAARSMPAGRMAPAGVRSMPAARFMSTRGRTFVPGQRSLAFRSRGFRTFPHRFHNRNGIFFGSTCFNTFGRAFPCANPFLFGGIGYPGDPFYGGYYSESEPQPVIEEENNDNGGNRELALEVQELSDEIQSMRDEDRAREERRNASSRPAAQDDGPNATLVFRDGLQLSVKNYAISGDTIWVLDEHNHQKVPLSKIDIAATQKINDQNGVEFRLPH